MKKKESEFGKGFIYNLVLFAKHYERMQGYLETNNKMAESSPDLWTKGEIDSWFSGAGDHFFEIEIPKQFENTEIDKIALELQDEAIERRLGKSTMKDGEDFFKKLEKLCRIIDKKLGVDSIEATWN